MGEKEREHELTNLRKDVAHRVSESVVDPATQRVYSLAIIDKALNEIGFNVDPSKNAKSQVLVAIKALQQHSKLPIQRARMRVRLTIPTEDLEKLEGRIKESAEVVENTEQRGELWEAVRLYLLHVDVVLIRTNTDRTNRSRPISCIQGNAG